LTFGILAAIAGIVAFAIYFNRNRRIIKKNPLSKTPDQRKHPAFAMIKSPNPLTAVSVA
jgi:drug/metabolite transporter (DMT)-like permease